MSAIVPDITDVYHKKPDTMLSTRGVYQIFIHWMTLRPT